MSINSYKLLLRKGCRLYPVFHCDLLSHATSSTSLPPHQAKIEADREEYVVDFISDFKIDNWPRRRGPYLHFLTHFVSFDIPGGCYLSKLMIVNNCLFFETPRSGMFSLWVKITWNLLLSIQWGILLSTNKLF